MAERRDRKYLRIYYNDLAREYPDVWASPILYWTYCRLLAVAEAMWPTVPEIPRTVKPARVRELMEYGLVIAVPPHGFRIRGHDKERVARQGTARKAALDRWSDAARNAQSNAASNAHEELSEHPEVGMPRRDETKNGTEKLYNSPKSVLKPVRSVEPFVESA